MKYLFIAIFVILVSCKSKGVKEKIYVDSSKVQAELQNQEIQSRQIMAPCGFYIGMNENQIVEYAKNNKKKFFTDKRYKMASLKTKIDDKVYSM